MVLKITKHTSLLTSLLLILLREQHELILNFKAPFGPKNREYSSGFLSNLLLNLYGIFCLFCFLKALNILH